MNKNKIEELKAFSDDYRFLLCTDMYQLTMNCVYMAENRHNEEVVFECFVRGVRGVVNPEKDVYYFSGEKEIHKMMEKTKEIFADRDMREEMKDEFINLVIPKVCKSEQENVRVAIEKAFDDEILIDYTVMRENTPVTPLVPVFMFRGSRWIGQLIETFVTNIVNGKTGYNTLKKAGNVDSETEYELKNLTIGIFDEELPDINILNKYNIDLENRAEEYRMELKEGQNLTEAAYRRAPSFYSAYMASMVALDRGWAATSNTTLYFSEGKEMLAKIGGSFAHSFVMGHNSEKEAFETWLKYFPESILLIDSYDVMNAVDIITTNRLKTTFVRIDSEPLDSYAKDVFKKFQEAGMDTKIYLSSDITPERIREFNEREIPCHRIMAGTKYVNCGEVEKINCGFVYKITVNSINGEVNYPEKKATGKKNYPGYKYVVFGEEETVMHYANGSENIKFGFNYMTEAEKSSKVLRVERVN